MKRVWNEKDRGLHRRSPWPWAVREYQKTSSHVLKSSMNEKQVAAMWVGQRAAEERWRGLSQAKSSQEGGGGKV